MPGSFIDILPPEAQHVLGGISVLVMAAGFVVWAAGVKIARFSVAILFGLAAAAIGAWLLPKFVGITVVTGGIVGFVAGALAGAVGFRLLQGLILATCLGLAVGGIYYRWHIAPTAPATQATDVHMSELMIPTDRLGPGTATSQSAAHQSDITAFGQSLVDHWNAIPPVDQHRLLIVSIGSAAIALLIAFGFARSTTWVISALLGSLMILSGIHALLHVYGPQYEMYLPASTRSRYLTLAILTLIGMGVQHRFFPRKPVRKAAPPPPAEPGPAAA